jgi:hypothetical protein
VKHSPEPNAFQSFSPELPLGRWRRRLLILAFLYLSVMGWARTQQAVQDWDLLNKFGAQPGALYQALSGGLWGILGLSAITLLYINKQWARSVVFILSAVIAASYWLDYFALRRNLVDTINWPFGLVVTLVGLLYCAWVVRVFPRF